MAASARKHAHPLALRLDHSDVAIIDRAARVKGRSRTEFMRDSAVQAAEAVLLENALIRMSDAGFKTFSKLLQKAPTVSREMVKLLKRPAPWDRDDL